MEKGVYSPREDSLLLASAMDFPPGASVLDMGTGTGFLAGEAAKKGAGRIVAVDISERALEFAGKETEKSKIKNIEFRLSDLFSEVPEKFDVIIFNPPYVPSEGIKYRDVDGGKKGREVLDRVLREMPGHLNENGICYFLQSSLNGIQQTEKLLKKMNFSFEIAARKKLFFEGLVVFRAGKP